MRAASAWRGRAAPSAHRAPGACLPALLTLLPSSLRRDPRAARGSALPGPIAGQGRGQKSHRRDDGRQRCECSLPRRRQLHADGSVREEGVGVGSGEVGGSRGARRRNPADHPSLPPSPSLPLRRPGAQEARLPLPDQLRQDAARPGDHGGEKGESIEGRETRNPEPSPSPSPQNNPNPNPHPAGQYLCQGRVRPQPPHPSPRRAHHGLHSRRQDHRVLVRPAAARAQGGEWGVGGGWGETRASPHPSLPRPVTTLLPKQNTERRPSGAGDSTDR